MENRYLPAIPHFLPVSCPSPIGTRRKVKGPERVSFVSSHGNQEEEEEECILLFRLSESAYQPADQVPGYEEEKERENE